MTDKRGGPFTTAKLHISVVEFTCPLCDEHLSSSNGSHLFPVYEIPETLECDACGAKLKTPKKALRLQGK